MCINIYYDNIILQTGNNSILDFSEVLFKL